MVNDYEHHIFVSYRRSDDDWVRWTRENLVRALASLLRPGLGTVKVVIDESIDNGAAWPNDLAAKLSRSRLMVAVLSRDYFLSDWCQLEFSLMWQREKLTKVRTRQNPLGLIIPIIIDDGECFPPDVQAMQGEKLHEYANPFIRLDSPKQEALAEALKVRVCPGIVRAMAEVPPYDPKWEELAHRSFEGLFQIKAQAQTTVPSLAFSLR